MTTPRYNRFYKELKKFCLQVHALTDNYKQGKIEKIHIKWLHKDWKNFTHCYEALRNENSKVNDSFLAVEKIMEQMLEPSFLAKLKQKHEPTISLIGIYLQQLEFYLEMLEISDLENSDSKMLNQQKEEHIRIEITAYCQKIDELLKKNTDSKIELVDIKLLKEGWSKLKKDYESLVQEGFPPNMVFQQVEKVAEQIFNDAFVSDLQKQPSWLLLETYLQQIQIQLHTVEFIRDKKDPKRPFLVNLWTWTLQKLEMLSLFYFIRNFFWPNYTKGNYRFVDAWLLGHTVLAFIYVFIANVEAVPLAVKYTLLVYGCLRMFEILIYQLNVILVHPYNSANYSLNSYRRMTIALIHNFIEIIFWFAGTFITLQFITDSTVPLAVYTSFTHMVTYSMNLDDSKWTILAIFILQFQAAIGVFMTVLSLARFVSLFPQPASQDPAEQEANEVRHAKLIEEIDNLKQTVEKNSAKILNNEQKISLIDNKDNKSSS